MYVKTVDLLEEIKSKVISEYHQKKLKASGTFEREIKVTRISGKLVLTLPYYGQFIMAFKSNKGGRPPGKFPPLDAIEQWIKDKKISLRDYVSGRFKKKSDSNLKAAAFLIARSIAESGTRIYKGEADPIDLDEIINNAFDYKGDEIADRIVQDIKFEP